MKFYKTDDLDFDYIAIDKKTIKKLYYLQPHNGIDVSFDDKKNLKKFMDYELEEDDFEKFKILEIKSKTTNEEVYYNKDKKEYLHSASTKESPFSLVKRERYIDFIMEDDLLKEEMENKVKDNWNRITENLDEKTLLKYFNTEKFQKEAYNSIPVDEFVKADLLIDLNKLQSTIKNYDFSKETDRLKAIEELDKQIKENLNNVEININFKELVRANPDFYDLDKLIKGEEAIILKTFQEVQFEKDGHTVKIQAVREQDITKEIIEERIRQKEERLKKIKDDPDVGNAQFTEEYIRKNMFKETIGDYENLSNENHRAIIEDFEFEY